MRGRRLSLGHLIMIVSGLLAFLLTLTLVRGRNEVFRVAVAGRDIPGCLPRSRVFPQAEMIPP